MMKLFIYIVAILPLQVFSQKEWQKSSVDAFLDVIRAYEKSIPENESYSIETSYKIYKNFMDETPIQTSQGKLLCKNGKELNVLQMGYFMVQNEQLNLVVDSLSRQIIIQNSDSSFYYRKTVADYALVTEMTTSVYTRTFNNKESYMLEFNKDYPYKAMEFSFIDKQNLSELIIYSNEPYYNEEESSSDDRAKIVMTIKNMKKGKSTDLKVFKTISDFIQINNGEFLPVEKYKHFEIIDLRN